MEDNRKEVDPSGQEHIEDEQSGESVRPLVADQNVNPSADEIRKAKKRAADKKYHDGQKRKIEDMERQSKKMRADYDELKGLHFYITGKLEQALADMEQIKEGYWSLQKVVKQQEALINMLQTPLVPGTTGFETGELGLPVVHHQPGGPVIPESLPLLRQGGPPYPPLSGGGLTPGADLFGSHGLNYTSSPGAAMVSGSSLMGGSFAPGGQLPIEVTGFGTGETVLPVFGTTMGSGGLAIEDLPGLLQSQLSQGWAHGNNSEQSASYNADQFPGIN